MDNVQVQPHLLSSCSYISSCSLSQTDAKDGSLARNQNSELSDRIVTNTSVPSGMSTCSISSILPSLTMALTVFNIFKTSFPVSAYPFTEILATGTRADSRGFLGVGLFTGDGAAHEIDSLAVIVLVCVA